jgi:DNA polymerase I-like protein with 3'-5' exonuclease and polymerase domains
VAQLDHRQGRGHAGGAAGLEADVPRCSTAAGSKTIQLQETGDRSRRREAKSMIDTFHKNWPAVRELQNRVEAHAKRGYIVGLDGRHLHMEEFGEHKLLNKLIQGSAAGLMKQAILNVHRELRASAALPTSSRAWSASSTTS